MTHTAGSHLTTWALVGGVLTWAAQWLLVSSGQPSLVPPLTWGVALGLMGSVLLALAWPIRAQVRAERSGPRVDPIFATRVVLLAKAGALAGALFVGAGAGFLVFFSTRPVLSPVALWLSGLALIGALVLMVAALVAERWCTLPPQEPERDPAGVPGGEVL